MYCILPLLYAQTNVHANRASLAAEITRLEQLSQRPAQSTQGNRERYQAFLDLARLYQLAGNSESALRTYNEAAAVFPGDGRILLEQSRLLISFGEYERARYSLGALQHRSQDLGRDLFMEAQVLLAHLEAFSTGSSQSLTALSASADYIRHRSSIYYALYQVTGNAAWRSRLGAEFSQSPEGRIAAAGNNPSTVSLAPTPLWLLHPGRLALPPAPPAPQAGADLYGTIMALGLPAQEAAPPVPSGIILQTGLFGREDNARGMIENLRRLGFDAQMIRREVNGGDYWMVGVDAGADSNAMIGRLRAAGFESFPVRF
ncbi:MAG: SPOR domain-containing protein [Treponema sp.]|nr:SPOR domain-containing protein [Treponema sp.]